MPYISKKDREKFDKDINDVDYAVGVFTDMKSIASKIENCGELNYVITLICQEYIKKKSLRYQNINDVVGALECCKIELYRRIAADYEDVKIQENGDVKVI